MLQASAVNCVPFANKFQGEHTHAVSRTQVKPNAFRVHYFADGTGRDTFVGMDNGGFMKSYKPAAATPVTSFVQKRRYDFPSPVIHSRAVQYHSDGTGRDSYIGFNKGGLAVYGSKTIKQEQAFRQGLRQHPRP